METKSHVPSFTVSLRGYDREEVDHYLDSLAEALGQVNDAEERNRLLQSHVTRLNSRIKELEDRIQADMPKTGAILGERIGILLRSAEETAAETIARAEVKVAEMWSRAEAKEMEAEEIVRAAVSRADDQARRIDASARGQAAEIVAEAEARAAARTRQIEQWAEQVVSHTRAEEARMLREHQTKKAAAAAEVMALAEQRNLAATTLTQLREALGRALGLVDSRAEGTAAVAATDAVGDIDDASPTGGASSGVAPVVTSEPFRLVEAASSEASEGPAVPSEEGEMPDSAAIELRDGFGGDDGGAAGDTTTDDVDTATDEEDDAADFDTKLEAWVSEGARHFRQE